MNLLKYNSWAVIVEDINKQSKTIECLKNKGYEVVIINRDIGTIEGINIYETLKDVPHNIDVVGILDETIDIDMIFDEMELLDIQNIWFEKGTYNEQIIKKAKSMKFNIEYKLNCHE